MTVTESNTTVSKSDTRPTVEEMFGNLQHQMELTYRPRETAERKRWWEEANKRLLGQPMICEAGYASASWDGHGPIIEGPSFPSIFQEATGLYRYSDNHLQPGKDFLAYAREELLDAINQVGVLSGKQRMDEKWGHVKERLVANAIEAMFKALGLLEAAQKTR